MLVRPLVQQAPFFKYSHWVWPLAKGFEQWQDDVKMYNIVWIWVEVCQCFSPGPVLQNQLEVTQHLLLLVLDSEVNMIIPTARGCQYLECH